MVLGISVSVFYIVLLVVSVSNGKEKSLNALSSRKGIDKNKSVRCDTVSFTFYWEPAWFEYFFK